MSVTKSNCWYSSNSLLFQKCAVPLKKSERESLTNSTFGTVSFSNRKPDEAKNLTNLSSTTGQCYKTFYGRKFRLFIKSQSFQLSVMFAGKVRAFTSEVPLD